MGDGVAPTDADVRITTPAAGAFNATVSFFGWTPGLGGSREGRVTRASVWSAATASPSRESTSTTLSPGERVRTASLRATRTPVTGMAKEKQAFFARTTRTWAAGDVSAFWL
jgi:hypothetical protein